MKILTPRNAYVSFRTHLFLIISLFFFCAGSDGEDSRRAISRTRQERNEEENFDKYSDEEDEDEEDIGDFIVDAEGQPIHGKKKKRKAIYTDAYDYHYYIFSSSIS